MCSVRDTNYTQHCQNQLRTLQARDLMASLTILATAYISTAVHDFCKLSNRAVVGL
jgi:hypothetical protein